jgi:hypothetical protein
MELLIVAGEHDRLAAELLDYASDVDVEARILSVEAASRLFTVHVTEDGSTVSPEIPTFLRPYSTAPMRTGVDEAFVQGECSATLLAACALTKAPVINRPSARGYVGRLTASGRLNELRANVAGGSIEIFSSDAGNPGQCPPDETWYVQDVWTGEATAWPAVPTSGGPYRGRWSVADPVFEIVTGLNGQAWRASTMPLEHLDLERATLDLLGAVDLAFGTAIWRIDRAFNTASLVRVDPFPPLDYVQFVWPALGPALVEALTQ